MPAGVIVLPRRWVVERTFAWLSINRLLHKDVSFLPEVSEACVYAAMNPRMSRRLLLMKKGRRRTPQDEPIPWTASEMATHGSESSGPSV